MASMNTVKLLWDLGNSLETNDHHTKLLKSHYLTTCRKIAKSDVELSSEKFFSSQMCPKCSSVWSDGDFSLKLKPQQIRSAKAKKLLAVFEDSTKKASLTKKQRTRAKWLRKKVTSNVEIKCNFCQTKTLQPLTKPASKHEKPKAKEASEEQTILPQQIVSSKNKTKKKRKKKDKLAGLKIDKIPAALVKTKEKHNAKCVTIVEADSSSSAKPDQPNIKTKQNLVKAMIQKKAKTKVQSSTSNLSKVTKSKKANKSQKLQQKPSSMLTTQSKTQQKNSLLHLAAMLKAQEAAGNTSRQESRLKNFLR